MSLNLGVYKIPCKGCNKFYIGESGRDLSIRVKEHKSALIKGNTNNALALHNLNTNHDINFKDTSLLFHCNNLKVRRIIEAAYINSNSCNTLNLNSGFFNLNNHVSHLIIDSIM